MQYALLIYDDEKLLEAMTPERRAEFMKGYGVFTQEIRASGHFVAGEPLSPVATATSVRVRDGRRVVTDGPFAETREQLGGFYVVEAKDLDEAVAIAARIPSSSVGTVEVRPIPTFEM